MPFESVLEGRKTPMSIGDRICEKLATVVPGPLRVVLGNAGAAVCRLLLSRKRFIFRGKQYPYFFDGYKLTWMTERAIEVPIVKEFVGQFKGKEILEVGNVLCHYFAGSHDVVDKYERAPGVINADIVHFDPGKEYELIISISTLEHVGFDEEPKEPDKIQKAVENLLRILAPGGKIVVTLPLGYNPDVDTLLESGWPELADVYYLKKTSWMNEWAEVDAPSAFKAAAEGRFFWLNGIAVLEFDL